MWRETSPSDAAVHRRGSLPLPGSRADRAAEHSGLASDKGRLPLGDLVRLRRRCDHRGRHGSIRTRRMGGGAAREHGNRRLPLPHLRDVRHLLRHGGGLEHGDLGHFRLHHCDDCLHERPGPRQVPPRRLLCVVVRLHVAHGRWPQHGGVLDGAGAGKHDGEVRSVAELRGDLPRGLLRRARRACVARTVPELGCADRWVNH
mmetsp:Transcript_96499/g.278523  ORF Transcript_96499/g.278523 Transcript_96499/m.278523 type:complete len:202 (-) Transcript_96499:69-674(-)